MSPDVNTVPSEIETDPESDGPELEPLADSPEASSGVQDEGIEPLALEPADGQEVAALEPEPGAEDAPGDTSEEAAEPSAKEDLGTGELRSDEELQRELAALLFSSPEAMGQARLRVLLERPSSTRVTDVLAALEAELEASPLPIVLRKIAGGWRLLTDPQLGDVVARMRKEQRPEKITGAAMETLAIIAYRQPVTKAEVEAIRGVQAGPMLRTLVDRGLARVSGRADLPGQPLEYGTTKDFLERFGLDSLKDLPRDGELNEE